MSPQPRHGCKPSALVWLSFFSFFPVIITVTTGTCPEISNPDCYCVNSSSSSTLPDITCTFRSQHLSPIFSNTSATSVSLGTLNLSYNALETLPSDFFQGIHAIHRLDLSSNLFTQFPPNLTTLGDLKILDLSDNLVNSVSTRGMASISGLDRLDLSRNKLQVLSTDGETADDVQLQSLQMLNLSWNSIRGINGDVFAPMRHLVGLDLSHNQLTEVTDTMFSPVKLSLNHLSLSHNLLQAIQPTSLQHLQHLHVLSLAHNPLREVKGVRFPMRLQSLDLSHCTLTIIDHCQLTALPDLGFIGLRGNHLRCTCQLYLLLQWYQDQHHKTGILETTDTGSNWTCTHPSITVIPPVSDSTSITHVSDISDDTPDSGQVQYVRDVQQCKDTKSHCQTLEHAQHHPMGSSQMVVTLDVASSGNILMVSWTFEDNGQVPVDGFQLHYLPEDGKPFDSPLISINVRSFVMRPSELEKHFMVCLDVLAYQTTVMHQQCHDFKDESQNIIVGILAAVVFLAPCLLILIYVSVKDHMIRKRWELPSLH